jgi:hypothetical protein
MSFAGNLAGIARSLQSGEPLFGFRNKIINGNFDIWQRGASFAWETGLYTADRWRVGGPGAGGAAGTVTREGFTLGQDDVPGSPTSFLRLARTATGTGSMALQHRIEGVRTLAGSRATLTFWAKGTNGKTVDVEARQNFGFGGSEEEVSLISQIALTSSWQKVSVAFDVPSLLGKTVGDDSFLEIVSRLAAAEGNMTLDIARVSLVAGDARAEADPFAERAFSQELELCKRFYQTVGSGIMGFVLGGGTSFRGGVSFSEMRAAPTPTLLTTSPVIFNGGTGTTATDATLSAGSITRRGLRITSIGGFPSMTPGNIVIVQTENMIGLDAEL